MRTSTRLMSMVWFVKVTILTGMGVSIIGIEGVYAKNVVELEEIVVSAQRRETNLQDTPIAITAFSSEDMRARSLFDTSELAQYVPNLSITPGAGNSRSPSTPQIFIRGIGQNDFIINSDPGVGLYVDGVYVSRATGSILDLLDVDRIEVLRGPQGTLFGKNTIGGAINITTRSPSDKLTYEAEILGGSYERIEARAYVSGPLSDKVAGKAAIAYKTRQGNGKRFDIASGDVSGRTGGNKNIIGRAGLRIEISDALTLDLSGDVTFNRDEQLTGSMEFFDTDPAQGVLALYNGLVGAPSGTLLTSALEIDDRYDSYATGVNFSDQDIYGGSAVLTWDVGAATIKSITAYRTLDSTLGSDGDGSPLPYLGSVYTLDQSQLSQELQMYGENFDGRFSWLAGLYYLKEDANELTFGFLGDGLFNALEMLPAAVIPFAPGSVCPGPFPPNVCLGGTGNPFNASLDIAIDYDYDQTVNSYAVFGEGTLQLSDDFALSVGLRFTEEDKTLDVNGIARRNSGQVIVPAGTQRKLSFAALTPRFRLEFTPTDDLLLYVSLSRGFKSGGINGRVFDAITLTEFNPEFVWTYEGGFKAELFSKRLRLNAAVFRNNYKDLQTSVQDAATGSINVFIANAAAAEITGFELEANARANEYFDLGSSVAYLDTKITETDPGVQQFAVGDRLQKVPKWSFTTYGQFTYPVSAGYEVLLRADYSFKSDYFNDPLLSQNIRQGDFGLLSLRLELASERGWTLVAFGTNLTDQDYIVAGLDGTTNGIGTVERIYGRPREWGLSLRYKY